MAYDEYAIKYEELRNAQARQNSIKNVYVTSRSMNHKEMIEYLERNSKIYVYGIGVVANKLSYQYRDYWKNVVGYIISDDVMMPRTDFYGMPICHLSEINRDAAILVAVDKELLPEIKLNLVGYPNVCFLPKE